MKNLSPLPNNLTQQIRFLRDNYPTIYQEEIEPLLPGGKLKLSPDVDKKLRSFVEQEQKQKSEKSLKISSVVNLGLQLAMAKSLVSLRLIPLLGEKHHDIYEILCDLEVLIPKFGSDFLKVLSPVRIESHRKSFDWTYLEMVTNKILIQGKNFYDPERYDAFGSLKLNQFSGPTLFEHAKSSEYIAKIQDFFLFTISYLEVAAPDNDTLAKKAKKVFVKLELLKGHCISLMIDQHPHLSHDQASEIYHPRRNKDYLFTGLFLYDFEPYQDLIASVLDLPTTETE